MTNHYRNKFLLGIAIYVRRDESCRELGFSVNSNQVCAIRNLDLRRSCLTLINFEFLLCEKDYWRCHPRLAEMNIDNVLSVRLHVLSLGAFKQSLNLGPHLSKRFE